MSITFTQLHGFASLQDHGRPGLAHLAIPTAGAFDTASHDLANRILGNHVDCVTVEFLRSNAQFVAHHNIDICLTGAPVDIRIDGRIVEMNVSQHVAAGAQVSIQSVHLGMRTYLAVRGGLQVEKILGSASYDELARIGNPPLVAQQSLAVGADTVGEVPHQYAVIPGIALGNEVELRVFKGPRWDFFDSQQFLNAQFSVSSKCNRVGVRLEGTPLTWDSSQRLPSEGVALGSIQVPVDGVPLIFGPDHPTTAGYPVIAVVDAADMSKVAQLSPGTKIRFSVQ